MERGSPSWGLWAHTCAWGAHLALLIPFPPLCPWAFLPFLCLLLSSQSSYDLKWKASEPVLCLPSKAMCTRLSSYTVSRPLSGYFGLELHLRTYLWVFKHNTQICTHLHRQIHMCTVKYIPWKALFVDAAQSHCAILNIYSSNSFPSSWCAVTKRERGGNCGVNCSEKWFISSQPCSCCFSTCVTYWTTYKISVFTSLLFH